MIPVMFGKQSTKQVKSNKNWSLKNPTTYIWSYSSVFLHFNTVRTSAALQRKIFLTTKASCSFDADSKNEAPVAGDRRKLPMPTCASWIMLTSLAPSPIANVMGFSGEVFNSRTTCRKKMKHFQIRQCTYKPCHQLPSISVSCLSVDIISMFYEHACLGKKQLWHITCIH